MKTKYAFSIKPVFLMAASFSAAVFSSYAGPLEDATALYNAGKFAEVDGKLGALLEQRPASTEALVLSFNAAVKLGRPYTAERRYNDLVNKGDKIPSDVLFKAAIVSGEIGKSNIRRDRLIYFLRNENGFNDNVEKALVLLCRDGGDGEHYTRLMKYASKSEAYFELGLSMLTQMYNARRDADYAAIVETLVTCFPDNYHTSRVIMNVRDTNFLNAGGIDPKFRSRYFSALCKAPVAKNPDFVSLVNGYQGFGARQVIDYSVAHKELMPIGIFKRLVDLRSSIPDAKERDSYGSKFKSMLSLVAPSDPQAKFSADHLQVYLEAILASPELFTKEGAPDRFSEQELATLFAKVATAKYNSADAGLEKLANQFVISKAWLPAHEATMVKTYPKLFDYRALFYNSKVAQEARSSKNGQPVRDLLSKIPHRYDIRLQCMPIFFDIKDGAMLKQITEEQIMAYPLDFSNDIARYFLCSDALSTADKVNFLKGIYAKTGYSAAWKGLVTFGALPKSLRDDATFKAFADSIKEGNKGSDPIAGAVTAIAQMKRGGDNSVPAEMFTFIEKALASYNDKFPKSGTIKSMQVSKLWDVSYNLVTTPADKSKLVSKFVKSFGKDAPFDQLLRLATDARSVSGQTNYMAVASSAIRVGAKSADDFASLQCPAGFPGSILAEYYKTMNPRLGADHLNLNMQYSWDDKVKIEQFTKFYTATDLECVPVNTLNKSLDLLQGLVSSTNTTHHAAVTAAVEPLAKWAIDQHKGASSTRAAIARVLVFSGNSRETVISRYLAAADKADPFTRYNDLRNLINQSVNVHGMGWQSVVPTEAERTEPKAWEFGAILKNKLLPTIKQIPLRQAGLLGEYWGYASQLETQVWRYQRKQLVDADAAATLSFCVELGRRAPCGMVIPEKWRINPPLRVAFGEFIDKGQLEDAAHIANLLGASFDTRTDNNGDHLISLLETATKKEIWEPAHIVASAVSSTTSAYGRFQRVRSECSTRMPGIYPVDESSPLYPLYVAADELERNNSERSWKLLNENIQTFEREASKLPAGFVAWGVEQLRYARGKEDELLVKARLIATTLLANEKALSPELAAALRLTRAECFRDQRNFEAASLEYQTIRNGAYYTGTASARKAMFRDVDLLIEMGKVSEAEKIVELWLSQPDVEIQAQAHYFLARIAFDRQDFEETRKQLEEVFNLNYTHTDARLLHGKWKLATNSEVDDTAVLVGDISDRTLIRPGQELTISVQDRNLGVAGGGSSIPVVIVTSVGKDAELLSLFPSARDPYLFSGTISTMLGVASPTNHILEVCGSDSVSYTVEPEFLKARGLTTSPPKVLRVVDDARLAVGAAAPLAEEGKAEDALEQTLISTGETRNENLTTNLKPGNPIYVVVRDRDRSLTTEIDELTVDARTSSGDRLGAITLTETSGVSGIFRGSIPTQLPPPRAIASDTAIGHNVADIINSKRNGLWKSAPDGKMGKWVEVDTMGSHVISNVAIMLPNSEEVTAIRLTGYLSGERVNLGELPRSDASKRLGIRYQVAAGNKRNSSNLIRSDFASPRAPAPKTVLGLGFTPVSNREQNQNAMLTMPFMLPREQSKVRFRLIGKDTKGRTLQGLWMSIAVDGVDVFTGQGDSLDQQVVDINVTPGPHLMEIFFSASRPDDALDILVDNGDGTTKPIPPSWIDPKVHPQLEDFVKDIAEIHRVKGGFKATFSKPTRLRSLRWEFLDYKGRELSVQKLYVQDFSGKMIIPAATDYSDALANEFLEVAPGDQIFVSYSDDRTSSGQKRVLERHLTSSFHDAKINFFFEEIEQTQNGNREFLYDAYRFVPGDMLLVSVRDPDGDITPEADKVKVRIETRSGKRASLTLTETRKQYANFSGGALDTDDGVHGGHFMAQLRTCPAGMTNAPSSCLPVAPGDVITLRYRDEENTRPGVPYERTISVSAAQQTTPRVYFFDTTVERVEDNSYDAKLRLEQIRRRPGNERIEKLYKDVINAKVVDSERLASTNILTHNVMTPIPIMVVDPSRARNEASKINIEAVALSELEDAEATGRDPDVVVMPITLGNNFGTIRSDAVSARSRSEAGQIGQFTGVIKLNLGPLDPGMEYGENEVLPVSVNGNDKVRIRILNDDDTVQSERYLQLVSAARLSLMDSTYSADREMAHVGERFFVMVQDPDQDSGEEINQVNIGVRATGSGVTRKVILKETLPHSGLFTGTVRPVIFGPGEVIPSVATGGVASTEAEMSDDRISVRYGDTVEFVYNDKVTIVSKEPGLIGVKGKVFKGSDGDVRVFSKRFRDSDMAVLVQFRLAECLFETAKEFRRMKQPDRSAEAIDEGKHILEEALRNYPTTIHLVQGEYLLANLYQELAMEQKEAGNKKASEPLFSEALSRFSAILSTWPESEFAAKAQYHKALCLEMLGDYNRASEEYVKMTYLYPQSPLVGDASIRLATYYYQAEKRYDTAGRIYASFQKRFPTHEKADRALFMAAQCRMKQAEYLAQQAEAEQKPAPVLLMNEEYKAAVACLQALNDQYRETASVALRAQAMYWAGDASLRMKDYQNAYLYLKRTTFEYPETEWARRARGLLLQESKAFEKLD